MKLHPPFEISPRLMPAVRIGNAFFSLDISGHTTADGRDIYECYIDLPDAAFEITDLRSGCQGGSVQEGMASLLTFLGAALESRAYRERTGRVSENEDLFDSRILDWAVDYADEISMLAIEIEETPNLIEE